MGFYNRTNATNYATFWALRRNPLWVDDSSQGGGGDCTNFISQAVLAGGWFMVVGARWDKTAWYANQNDYDRQNRSWSWAGAENFSQFLRKSGRAEECDKRDVILGDLVQEHRFGQIIHTMMVTKIDPSGRRYLSYHSTDRLNRPLDEILQTSGKDTSFIYWKLYDLYPEALSLTKWAGIPFID